ncbi:hypothetical protein FS837_008768 [Tulasnella sp. UAMH 9824]|nr:hypothetical protein FS837_008768 [Tulasnella sp. UAMH 9824]
MPGTVEKQKYIEAHLRRRYEYFAQSDLKVNRFIRESTDSYIDRFRSTTPPAYLRPQPSYPLDDSSSSLGRRLYGYIDLPPCEENDQGVSVAVPTNWPLVNEYKSLTWLFKSAKHYGADINVYRCATEDDVDEAALRKALSKGHYCVVGAVDPSTNIYAGTQRSPFDPLMRQLHPLGAKVRADDTNRYFGAEPPVLNDEKEEYCKYRSRSVAKLEKALTLLFGNDWSLPKRKRLEAEKPPDEPVQWTIANISFGQFVESSEDHESLYDLDSKLFTSGCRPEFIQYDKNLALHDNLAFLIT